MTEKKDPLVAIAGTISGVSVGLVALIVLFSESDWVAAPVVGAMAVLGIALAYFATKRR